MTTATATSPTAELERAERELAKASKAAQAAEERLHAAEPRPRPFGYVPERNPEWPRYVEARERLGEARGAVEHLRRAALRDRLGELGADADALALQIREALTALAESCARYTQLVEQGRALVAETKPLTGQHFAGDPRPSELRHIAQQALEGDAIAPPGLTEIGAFELDRALAQDAARAEEKEAA